MSRTFCFSGPQFDTRIQGGVLSDGIGGFVSALFTVTPLSIFAQVCQLFPIGIFFFLICLGGSCRTMVSSRSRVARIAMQADSAASSSFSLASWAKSPESSLPVRFRVPFHHLLCLTTTNKTQNFSFPSTAQFPILSSVV